MVFNDTIYKTFVVVNFAVFILISAIGAEQLLPPTLTEEVVVRTHRKIDYIPSGRVGGIYRAGGERPSEDTDYLETEHFWFRINRMQRFGIYPHDTVRIYQGRLFGMVVGAELLKAGEIKEIERSVSLFGNLVFIPVITFITALIGVAYYRKNALTVEVGVMNLLLAAIILCLLK